MILHDKDLNIIRQWFNAVQDCAPKYLTAEDYQLSVKIHEALGVPVCERTREGAGQ